MHEIIDRQLGSINRCGNIVEYRFLNVWIKGMTIQYNRIEVSSVTSVTIQKYCLKLPLSTSGQWTAVKI